MRLFLALELPVEVRERLALLQSELRKKSSGWRWVRPESIHLTLRFLGEVDEHREPACRQGWREAVARFGRFRARVEGLGRFPETGRPRVLWVAVRAEPEERLGELASALEGAARSLGFAPETRPFRPHLTLARAHRRPRFSEPGEPVPAMSLPVEEVVLFRSRLGPGGARYTALSRFPLRD
jgi:2'-5' RNA ligase